WWDDAGQATQRRSFAGAIGADQPDNFPRLHREREFINRNKFTIQLRQSFNLDHSLVFGASLELGAWSLVLLICASLTTNPKSVKRTKLRQHESERMTNDQRNPKSELQ